jgi:POTRA domain, FtsQ-type
MDFLNKILSHLGQDPNKQFRKQVQAEKKQKYLFSDDLTDKYRSSRSGFFSRKKKAIAPFANSFTTGASQIKKRFDDSHMLAYMGLFLMLLSGYIIFFSPYFRVSPSHVLIEANNDGIDVSVAYRAIEDIYGSSLFWLDEETVAYTLKKSLKNLAHVTIDKLYPNGVKILMTSTPITYKSKIYGFEREWEMSDNGVLIPKMPSG